MRLEMTSRWANKITPVNPGLPFHFQSLLFVARVTEFRRSTTQKPEMPDRNITAFL